MEVIIFQDDVSLLRPLVESWRDNADNSEFNFDMKVCVFLAQLKVMIESPGSDLLVLQSKEGRPLGLMGVMATSSPIGNGWLLYEHYWYIVPEHRGQGALKLLKAAEEWGRDRGCEKFSITASKLANRSHDRICRLYERLGFKHFETVFIKDLV